MDIPHLLWFSSNPLVSFLAWTFSKTYSTVTWEMSNLSTPPTFANWLVLGAERPRQKKCIKPTGSLTELCFWTERDEIDRSERERIFFTIRIKQKPRLLRFSQSSFYFDKFEDVLLHFNNSQIQTTPLSSSALFTKHRAQLQSFPSLPWSIDFNFNESFHLFIQIGHNNWWSYFIYPFHHQQHY